MKSLFSYKIVTINVLLEGELQADRMVAAPLRGKAVRVIEVNFSIALFFLLERNSDSGAKCGTCVPSGSLFNVEHARFKVITTAHHEILPKCVFNTDGKDITGECVGGKRTCKRNSVSSIVTGKKFILTLSYPCILCPK